MNLDELQRIQSKERQTDSVQPLRAEFYEEVGEYIQALRAEREQVADEQGFDAPEFRQLSDEIDAAEDTVESLYERRVGKIVKAASFAAAGMPAEDEGLTDEEQRLFDRLVTDIEQNRDHVLDVLAGEADPGDVAAPGSPTDATATPDPADTAEPAAVSDQPDRGEPADTPPAPESVTDSGTPGVDAADLMGEDAGGDEPGPADSDSGTETVATDAPDSDPADHPAPGADADRPAPTPDEDAGTETTEESSESMVDRTTLRITRDVGEILGVDERAYDLGEDDVVTLPEANAGPLVDRDAAERLE